MKMSIIKAKFTTYIILISHILLALKRNFVTINERSRLNPALSEFGLYYLN